MFEHPHILVPISVEEFPLPALLVELVVALEPGSVGPGLFPIPVSLVVLPVTFVFTPTEGNILPVAMGLIVFPVTVVVVPVGVVKPTLALCLVVDKLPRVVTSIREIELAKAVLLSAFPLAEVVALLVQLKRSWVNIKLRNRTALLVRGSWSLNLALFSASFLTIGVGSLSSGRAPSGACLPMSSGSLLMWGFHSEKGS